jgi:hypothetical protein
VRRVALLTRRVELLAALTGSAARPESWLELRAQRAAFRSPVPRLGRASGPVTQPAFPRQASDPGIRRVRSLPVRRRAEYSPVARIRATPNRRTREPPALLVRLPRVRLGPGPELLARAALEVRSGPAPLELRVSPGPGRGTSVPMPETRGPGPAPLELAVSPGRELPVPVPLQVRVRVRVLPEPRVPEPGWLPGRELPGRELPTLLELVAYQMEQGLPPHSAQLAAG